MVWQGHQRTSTTQWRTLRQQILERDQHTCICGNPANEVDHIRNWAAGGTDDPTNLTAICPECHKRKTAREGLNARMQRRQALKRAPKRHPGDL